MARSTRRAGTRALVGTIVQQHRLLSQTSSTTLATRSYTTYTTYTTTVRTCSLYFHRILCCTGTGNNWIGNVGIALGPAAAEQQHRALIFFGVQIPI